MKRVRLLLLFVLVPLSLGTAQEIGLQTLPPPSEQGDGGGYVQSPRRPGQDIGIGIPHSPGKFPQEMERGNPQIRRQLEQIKIWQMTRELDLPTEKAERFFPLYNRYNDEMRSITAERRWVIIGLDSAVDNNVGSVDIQKDIQRLIDLDNRLANSHVKFIEAMGQFLTPVEVAKYLVFEQKFDREIRDRIRMIMMQRRRGPNR